jgi:hypothetical protein
MKQIRGKKEKWEGFIGSEKWLKKTSAWMSETLD